MRCACCLAAPHVQDVSRPKMAGALGVMGFLTSSLMSAQMSPRPQSGAGSADPPAVFDRPNSPTESVFSTTNSSAPRPLQRLQVGHSTDTKAAPAVGSSKANATGVLEVTTKLRSEGSPERSGRISPASAAGTVRGQRRGSAVPISTYGLRLLHC